MRILGIETSCDDTGAAVLEEGRLLSNVVTSQEVHAAYGGIVPEFASRAHITLLPRVVARALEESETTVERLDGVAATLGPGLVGSLLVGIEFAKGLATARGIPWIGVNHVEAHLVSPALEADLPYPHLGLVASGGHTELYYVEEPGRNRRIGSTRDDAAGEAFDKIGKVLGLPYPGGPHVDRLARDGNAGSIAFPVADLGAGSLDFSFSGLKTAVKLFVDREPRPIADSRLRDIAASSERAIVSALISRLEWALGRHAARALTISGGCACNTLLRREASRLAQARGIPALFPSPILCRDNGAMIAYAGWLALRRGERTPYEATAVPNLDSFPTS